jgi:hypothetical protein
LGAFYREQFAGFDLVLPIVSATAMQTFLDQLSNQCALKVTLCCRSTMPAGTAPMTSWCRTTRRRLQSAAVRDR